MMTADLILPRLDASSKKQAFRDIANAAAPLYGGSATDLLSALLERERIGSTGIGSGAAIPHVKVRGADRMYAILARLDAPVDYDAIDGKPVDVIFVLLAPEDSKTTQHLKVLAMMSRYLRDAQQLEALRAAADDGMAALVEGWIKAQAA